VKYNLYINKIHIYIKGRQRPRSWSTRRVGSFLVGTSYSMKAWYISVELRRARRVGVMRDPRSVIPRSSRDRIVDFGSAPLVPITLGSTLPGSCRSCFASVGINGVYFLFCCYDPPQVPYVLMTDRNVDHMDPFPVYYHQVRFKGTGGGLNGSLLYNLVLWISS